MNENIRIENWCGYDIRFVEHEGNWYAVLKDICDALKLRTCDVKLRIECDHLIKTAVECVRERPELYKNYDPDENGLVKSLCDFDMLCVDEAGIYQALSRSTRLEARKFIDWISHSLVDLRKAVGLEAYEALRLTDADVQKLISDKIDIPYVEPTGDLIPVAAEPTTIIQNITNVDYRKAVAYGVLGGVCAIAVGAGVVHIVKKIKAKKVEKKELTAEADQT